MGLPRVRLTIGLMMVAIALVAVALVALPEPALVIRLPAAATAPVTLPDGTTVGARRTQEINVTRLGALLLASTLGAVVLATARLVEWLLGIARRATRNVPP